MTMITDVTYDLPRLSPIPWAKFRAEVLSEYKPPTVAKETGRKMAQLFRAIEGLQVLTITDDGSEVRRSIESTADLTPQLVAAFRDSRSGQNSLWTLYGDLAMLRTLCTRAELSGYLRVSPFKLRKLAKWLGSPLPPPGRGKPRHASREQIRALLDLLAAGAAQRKGWSQWRARRLRCAVAIVAYCGLRRNECLRLQVGDVDVDRRVLWIRPHGKKLKTAAASAPIAMPAALVPILTDWLEHRLDAPFGFPVDTACPWLIPGVRRKSPWIYAKNGQRPLDRLQAAAKRAGIEYITWQALRRSCATHLEAHGASRAVIKRILRHTTERTSEKHYSEADIPNLLACVDEFDFS
jgi:integrase